MAVAIAQTANPAGVNHSSNVTTYTAASVGVASSDRIVVVAIGKEVASVSVSSVTIDGGAATLADGATFNDMGAWLYYRALPSGTTADIAVTWSGAITSTQNHIAVYAVTGGTLSTAGNDTSDDMDATDPLTTGSTTIPANGGMLAVAVGAMDAGGGSGKTWANLTEDIDSDVGVFKFTTATSTTSGTATRTCTGGADGEDGALAWAIFAPAAAGAVTTGNFFQFF